jgi:succinate dehydrogenase cytochrome b subunit
MTPADRPLSPFMIPGYYRLQLTSALSFAHRATGVALAVGAVLLVWWLLAASAGPGPYAVAQAFLGSWLGVLLLIGWTFAFFYHLCNGIRHLVWDSGHGFELGSAYASGWTVLGASAALSLIALIAGFVNWG